MGLGWGWDAELDADSKKASRVRRCAKYVLPFWLFLVKPDFHRLGGHESLPGAEVAQGLVEIIMINRPDLVRPFFTESVEVRQIDGALHRLPPREDHKIVFVDGHWRDQALQRIIAAIRPQDIETD